MSVLPAVSRRPKFGLALLNVNLCAFPLDQDGRIFVLRDPQPRRVQNPAERARTRADAFATSIRAHVAALEDWLICGKVHLSCGLILLKTPFSF